MITVIKDLNDRCGITHRAQPAEPPFHVMAMASDLGEGNQESKSFQEEKTMATFNASNSGNPNNNNGNFPKKVLGIEKGWAGWNKLAETAKLAATNSDPGANHNNGNGNGWNGKNNKKKNWNNQNNGNNGNNNNQYQNNVTSSQQQPQQHQQQQQPLQQPQQQIQQQQQPSFQRAQSNANQANVKPIFNNGIKYVPAGTNVKSSNPSNGGNGSSTVTSDTTQSNGQTNNSIRSCFHCGDTAHIAKDCETWNKLQKQRRARMICTKCNKNGHWAKYCRENRDEGDPNAHLPPDQRWPVNSGRPATDVNEQTNQQGN